MNGPSDNEAALVQQAALGDQEAFAALYERYFDAVYDFLTRLVRDREAAADLTQDTFIRAMNNIAGLQKGGSFKSWLFTIAHNAGLNHLQRAARTQPMPSQGTDDDEPAFDVVDPDRFASPEEAAQAKQIAALVWEAAAGLDERQYAVLDLTLRQGLESAELAEVMGVSTNNAYVMVNRMKKTLEDSVAALLLFRDRRHCAQLGTLLAANEVTALSPDTRRLIDRHAGRCELCQARRASLVSPSAILGGLAFVPAPAGLKLSIGEALRQAGSSSAGGEGETSQATTPSETAGNIAAQYREASGESYRQSMYEASRKRLAAVIAVVTLLILGIGLALGSGSIPEPREQPLAEAPVPPGITAVAQPAATERPAALPVEEASQNEPPSQGEAPPANETPQPLPTVAVVQPPPTPAAGILPAPGGGSTPVPSMPGGPGLAPGGDGPAPTSTAQPGVAIPTPRPATPTPQPPATPQTGALVINPTNTPVPAPPCAPQAVLAPTTLEFTGSQTVQTITLRSDGCSSATTFNATPSASWLTATPGSGSIPLNGTQAVSVRIIPGSMANGLNTGRVTIATSRGNIEITVRGTKASVATPCPAPCLVAP